MQGPCLRYLNGEVDDGEYTIYLGLDPRGGNGPTSCLM